MSFDIDRIREDTAALTPGDVELSYVTQELVAHFTANAVSRPRGRGTQTDYGNQHVHVGNHIYFHNSGNGSPEPRYACVQTTQVIIDYTPTFKATKRGRCAGNVIDHFQYTWEE
jgi:hypothetical protein